VFTCALILDTPSKDPAQASLTFQQYFDVQSLAVLHRSAQIPSRVSRENSIEQTVTGDGRVRRR
jgi:hypothetical protein